MQAVLDPNVLVSSLLSRSGTPAELLRRWLAGEFELIISPVLLAELERVLLYPKLGRRIARQDAAEFVELLRAEAAFASDDDTPPRRSADPDDDHLLALAATQRALLVSGDRHLLAEAAHFPVLSPREFLDRLAP